MRGGIAERGGVRVGHRIIEINSQSVVATPHEKIVQILSNAMGEVRDTFFFHAFKEHNFKKPHPYDCAMMWGKFFFYVIEKLGNQLHKITFCFLYVGPRSTWKQCLQPCIACWPPRNNQFTSEHQLHIFLQSDSCQTLHYCHLFALIWTTGTPTSEPAECLHLLFLHQRRK